jgi:hypothetical protein
MSNPPLPSQLQNTVQYPSYPFSSNGMLPTNGNGHANNNGHVNGHGNGNGHFNGNFNGGNGNFF